MATGMNGTVANGFLNALFRAANYTAPVACYLKLHIGDPGASGTSNPATETTRKVVTCGTAASGGSIANTAALSWTSVAGSEDFTHFSLWDASTSGNYLGSGALTANPVTAGDNFDISIGALTFSFPIAS